jgi:hypothetical protein
MILDNTQDPLVIEQESSNFKRFNLINFLIDEYNFKDYLEIGVAFGTCIRNVKAQNKDAVDPVVEPNVRCPEINYEMTSDDFFKLEETKDKFYDIIFIDGLHHSDQVDIDIQNSLKHLREGGFILLHDCNPVSYESQLVPRQAVAWNGDVWKSIIRLRWENKLEASVVDTDYGVGVVRRGKSEGINQSIHTLENCLDWEYFQNNKKHLLDLITPNEFFKKYTNQ